MPGAPVVNPASINFVRTGASFSQTNEWPLKIGTAISVSGQYGAGSLPTSEQISFGAQRVALGYQLGEASGDSGWGATLEVNRAFTPGFTYPRTLTPYISFGMARVYLHAGAPSPSKLSSIAFGFRLSAFGSRISDLGSRMQSITAWNCRSPSRWVMRPWRARRAVRVSTPRSRIS